MTDNENTMSEQAIKDKDYTLAITMLKTLGFFSQRENYELWDNNPKGVKYKDIASVAYDIKFLKDFINRQRAEIGNLEYKLLGVMHFVDKWLDGTELEQDEVNRASAMREKTLQIVEKQQAEIERLKEGLASKNLEYSLLERERAEDISVFVDDLKFAKVEAIKEFAERLKKPNRWRVEDIYYIDTLVEEMVGEQQ